LTTSPPNNPQNPAERRRTARFPFAANAELTETASGTRVNTRVTEISLYGCYLDMTNPPPVGTAVFVKIFTQADFFETAANVVYSHPNTGIGLAFHDVSKHFLPTLQKWLLEALRSTTPSR